MNTDEYVSVSDGPVTGLPLQLCSAQYESCGCVHEGRVVVRCDLPMGHEDRHHGATSDSNVTLLWP